MRQEAAFFDRPNHSTGTLTTMLGKEATAMSGLSGSNLGTIISVLTNLTSGIILALFFCWQLGLVSLAVLPIMITAGFFRFHLLTRLSEKLKGSYKDSATMACEQVASIRTVASLRRERSLHQEFCESLREPVREATLGTLNSTLFYALSMSLGFFTNSLIFWYGSTLLVKGEINITRFFVWSATLLTIYSHLHSRF